MRKIDSYIIEKLHISKGMKTNDFDFNKKKFGKIPDIVGEYIDNKYKLINISDTPGDNYDSLVFIFSNIIDTQEAADECKKIQKLIEKEVEALCDPGNGKFARFSISYRYKPSKYADYDVNGFAVKRYENENIW